MSRVKVNEITNKVATGPVDFPDGITGVALTVTGNVTVGGTIISEDTTNVDSVGWVTARSGLTVGPPATGIGATIHANGNAVFAGITTFGDDVTFTGAAANVTWDNSTDDLIFADNAQAKFGTGGDLSIYHSGTDTFLHDSTSTFIVKASGSNKGLYLQSDHEVQVTTPGGGETMAKFIKDGACELYYNDAKKLETQNYGVTLSDGGDFQGNLRESVNVTAGKLSDNLTINLDNGMLHLFTTTETATAVPNIMSTVGINTELGVGDAIAVTLITTAAAAAYCTGIQVDGVAVTENWIGGSAPSDGGSSGVDIHSFNIIKTASATFTVIGNQSKTS